MKKIMLSMCVFALIISGCTNKRSTETQSPDSVTPPSINNESENSIGTPSAQPEAETKEPTKTEPPSETEDPEILSIIDSEHWLSVLEESIINAEQMPVMDITSAGFSQSPDLDAKNLYYALLAEHREYCYAYDLNATVTENQMTVEISYMPYRTGDYPADFSGEIVGSLRELFDIACAHLGEEAVAIQITKKELLVDDMNGILSQIGGSYLLCQLSRDGTAIHFSPNFGLTMDECMKYLTQVDELAKEIVEANISDGMHDSEKVETLYQYLTQNVVYDQRYYSDPLNMPPHSRTAYGALHDNLAICGGYALAFQRLLEEVGIRCYTVSGKYNGENHMWCAMFVDGELLYYDPTADRGTDAELWRYFGVTEDRLFGHDLFRDYTVYFNG